MLYSAEVFFIAADRTVGVVWHLCRSPEEARRMTERQFGGLLMFTERRRVRP